MAIVVAVVPEMSLIFNSKKTRARIEIGHCIILYAEVILVKTYLRGGGKKKEKEDGTLQHCRRAAETSAARK